MGERDREIVVRKRIGCLVGLGGSGTIESQGDLVPLFELAGDRD